MPYTYFWNLKSKRDCCLHTYSWFMIFICSFILFMKYYHNFLIKISLLYFNLTTNKNLGNCNVNLFLNIYYYIKLGFHLFIHLIHEIRSFEVILCWNAQDDKMPKYDKLPKVNMPKWHFAQSWQNAQVNKMPIRHLAQDNNMPKKSFCPRWQIAQIVLMTKCYFCNL